MDLLVNNIQTINKTTDTLTDASKEVLEVNVEKPKYMLVSCDQNAGHNRDIQIPNRTYEQLKYLEMTVTCKNLIQGKIKG
jgi:hypothetical protein